MSGGGSARIKGLGGVGVCAEVHGEFTYQFAGKREGETCSRDINFSYSRGPNCETSKLLLVIH